MQRNQKIVLVSHCYFNQNSVVSGEARTQSYFFKLLNDRFGCDVSFIQMACPEYEVLGLKRQPVGTNDLLFDEYSTFCNTYANYLIKMIHDYLEQNNKVLAIVGIKGSPSCGITQTCTSYINNQQEKVFNQVIGEGIFMQHLKMHLKANNFQIEMIELD